MYRCAHLTRDNEKQNAYKYFFEAHTHTHTHTAQSHGTISTKYENERRTSGAYTLISVSVETAHT